MSISVFASHKLEVPWFEEHARGNYVFQCDNTYCICKIYTYALFYIRVFPNTLSFSFFEFL